MERSRRRHILGCHEELPSVKVFSLHTEQNAKPKQWHCVHRGYQKVAQGEGEMYTCSVSANKILALWKMCVRVTSPFLWKWQLLWAKTQVFFRCFHNSSISIFTVGKYAEDSTYI
jgi:hypothetical protein